MINCQHPGFFYISTSIKKIIMRKNLLLNMMISALVFIGLSLNAQTQFDNASFEEWEEIGFGPDILEPVNWSSIKSTDDPALNNAAPIVWARSEDAHTGNYSLFLNSVAVFGIVATGTMTNGRVHASYIPTEGFMYTDPDHSEWHTRITGKPDSLVGWYKAMPRPNDYGTVKIVLHEGYLECAENIDSSNYIASGNLKFTGDAVEEWTRFSLPINYYLENIDPEFALVILTSSQGVDAIPGSKIWFDDLELIYNNNSGIAEENAASLSLFAANNRLHLFIDTEKSENYILNVYDISGRFRMKDTGVTGMKNTHAYQLPSGIYIVSVQYDGKVLTKKIVL